MERDRLTANVGIPEEAFAKPRGLNPPATNWQFVRDLIAYAYEHGYHEHGYDVLAELLGQVRAGASREPGEPPDVRAAAQALADVMPKGEALRSFHAGREVMALREALAAPPRETSDGWQPIETAPKDGRWLLLGSATSCFMGYWEFGEWRDQRDAVRDPTHWQPLPQPLTTAGCCEAPTTHCDECTSADPEKCQHDDYMTLCLCSCHSPPKAGGKHGL